VRLSLVHPFRRLAPARYGPSFGREALLGLFGLGPISMLSAENVPEKRS
jgi:hypothetical protein